MKKVLVIATVAFVALSAFADVMNWQVGNTPVGYPTDYTYDAARLVAKSGSNEIVINDNTGRAYQAAEDGLVDTTTTTDLSQLGVDLNGYTFYIELGSYANNVWTSVAQSEVDTYANLRSSGIIGNAFSTGGVGGSGATLINPAAGSYSAVPEPGTATLILLGMAVAGLKRRRV